MDNFQEIKNEILRRGREANACDEIDRAEASENLAELAQVIKDNFDWCVYNRVLDTEIISKYKEDFAGVGIYANESCGNGYVVIDRDVEKIYGEAIAILCGNAKVNRVCGDVIIDSMYGNATVNKVSGEAIIKCVYGDVIIDSMCGNSIVSRLCGNAVVNEVCDNAVIKCVYGKATVNKVYGNAVINDVWGNATVCEVCGEAYISVTNYIECKINDHAIMRVRSENRIYTNTEVVKPNNN